MPQLFRWFGRLRPTQHTAEVSDDFPWQDRVDQVRAMMDALAPDPSQLPKEGAMAEPENPAAQSGDDSPR